jgi:PhoPQ-activated pathogenicity-related protein
MFTLKRCAALVVLAVVSAPAAQKHTALDRYVAAPDRNYKYELVTTLKGPGVTASVLGMTSQSWRSAEEVDRTLWKHWVTIFRPAEVKSNTGLLFITGGANNGKPPSQVDAMLAGIAADTGTVVTELRMVPNQPLLFKGETKGRSEDELIAYTWDKFLRGGDDEWPARLPMTKSAVRAMDTVTAFCGSEQGGRITVDKFVVAGGSKRGWTTWTTAVVDKRVVAIAPLVIDLLNIRPSFEHHWRVYGFWAPAIHDYEEMKIMDWSRSPRYQELMKIEEPYEYRDRLTLPKMMINATGDQFFLPDSWQFYWNDLKGEKHIRYVPNADHSLRKTDAVQTLQAFYTSIVEKRDRPKLTWKVEKDGTIRVKTQAQPETVKLWQATNPEARDFRLEKIGAAWKETPLAASSPGVYEAKVLPPSKGFTAYFIELTYPSGGKYPLKETTGVKVVPDTYPSPPFQPRPVN